MTLVVATLILQALSQFAFINLYQLPSAVVIIKIIMITMVIMIIIIIMMIKVTMIIMIIFVCEEWQGNSYSTHCKCS